MSSDSKLTRDCVGLFLEPPSSAAEVGSELCWNSTMSEKIPEPVRTLWCQFYFGLGKFLGPREEESRSDNQEQEHIDGTGEAEHRVTKKRNCRRYLVVTEL